MVNLHKRGNFWQDVPPHRFQHFHSETVYSFAEIGSLHPVGWFHVVLRILQFGVKCLQDRGSVWLLGGLYEKKPGSSFPTTY